MVTLIPPHKVIFQNNLKASFWVYDQIRTEVDGEYSLVSRQKKFNSEVIPNLDIGSSESEFWQSISLELRYKDVVL